MTSALLERGSAAPPASARVVADWTALMPGDFITVVEQHALRHSGWIDDLTADGSVLWLVRTFGGGRRMFCRDDGDVVLVEAP